MSGGPEALGESDHLGDVLGRPRVALGALDAQGIEIFEERPDERVDDLVQGPALVGHLAEDLVFDVGDVHHLGDSRAQSLERPPENVLPYVTAEITDVREVVDGRAARVHPYVAGLE